MRQALCAPLYPPIETKKADVMSVARTLLDERVGESPASSSDTVLQGMHREVQLALWQLDRLARLHEQAKHYLFKTEAALETDLERLNLLGARFVHPHDPRGTQIKDRLASLSEKRTKLDMDFFDREMRCLERLAVLVGRHELLSFRK